MGKIRVQDLAKRMGIPDQDLMFKLRSIGVRIEGEESLVDTEMISAILQGKRLPNQPREVILRDDEAQKTAPPPPRNVPTSARRPPAGNLLRKHRPRTMIQRVDTPIRNLPSRETAADKPGEAAPAEVTEPAATTQAPVEETTTTAAAPAEAPAAQVAQAETSAADAKTEAAKPADAAPKASARVVEDKPLKPAKKLVAKARKLSPEAIEAERRRPRPAPRTRIRTRAATPRPRGGAPAGIQDPNLPTTERQKRRVQRRQEQTSTTEIAFKDAKPTEPVMLSEGMTVRDFAEKLGVKAKDLIKALFQRGIMANINHVLELELAEQLASDIGVETMVVSFEEELQLTQEADPEASAEGVEPRAPVVTIMGHVDHGKTSLLDRIRSSRVADGEAGGITQHIGAYKVAHDGKPVVFLDTPGHEAFTSMRSRGAQATDIVVLMVAADDGVMPQTVEAIEHARAAKVPILVAINKVDKDNANVDRVKTQLSENNLLVEDWGGDTVAVQMSALKGEGVPEMLEMIQITSELADLKANPELPGQGVVLEARKDIGRGIIATVLVQDGTLQIGDLFVSGATWGRVRAMNDDLGQRMKEAGPSTPVEVTGFGDIPQAGDLFQVVTDEAKARSISEFRRQEQRQRELSPMAGKLSLEQLFDRIQEGDLKELPVVLKADVQGSVEVLRDALKKLSTDKVKVEVILAGVGAISTNDVVLANASGAIIVGFNVRPERKAAEMAEKEGIEIRLHTVIYELTEELKKAMAGLLEPEYQEVITGRAEVREIFKVPKAGMVAGCHILEGKVPRNAEARLLRDNVVIYSGKVGSLRRFKEDVSEVRAGFDCGISLDRYQDAKPGDVIEAFVKEEVAPTL